MVALKVRALADAVVAGNDEKGEAVIMMIMKFGKRN